MQVLIVYILLAVLSGTDMCLWQEDNNGKLISKFYHLAFEHFDTSKKLDTADAFFMI